MTKIRPEVEGSNIILRGDFNPKIFQPAWFAAQGLLREEEANNAEVEIIHPAIVRFSLDWFQLEVSQDRFFIGTTQIPYYEILWDLVSGTFKILPHSPITKMGINFDFHYKMASEEDWHAVGHLMAPKQIWKDILEKPGMRSLSMQGQRPDEYKGYIMVRIEPSRRIEYGLFISINDHYEIKDPESSLGCKEIIEMLDSSWKSSYKRSNEIVTSIVERVK